MQGSMLSGMARNQKNFENFLYVDDNSVSWTKRGEIGGDGSAVDGHASGTGAPTWIDGPRISARRIVYHDSTTLPPVRPLFYTAAASASVSVGNRLTATTQGPP